MNLEQFDATRCDRPQKEIVEGFCLCFDLIRRICLETGQGCDALEPLTGAGGCSEAAQ